MKPVIRNKIETYFSQYDVKTYAKGELITLANQAPAGISLLVSGVVEQYDISTEGNKITLNIYKPPAFFPMSWAINQTPNSYFFGAITKVTLRQADPAATVQFLRANPDVLFDLLSRVYTGTDILMRRLALAASGIAVNRLLYELLIEAYRFGVPSAADQTVLTIRQNTLAARSGLARETVSRELHKLEKHNLLALTKEGITINIDKLEAALNLIA